MFTQLSEYVACPNNPRLRGFDFRHAVGRLASLTDDDCIHEPQVFYWSLLDCVNFCAHAAGLVNTMCGQAFKHFLAGRLLYYMGPDEIALLKRLLGENCQQKSQAELVCHFLDTFMTTIEYDLLGCFQQSFEGSVELNDIIKYRSAMHASRQVEHSYIDASARFLRGTVRFIDNVEKRPGLRANVKKDVGRQRAQDQSLIYCLGLIFQYFGSDKIYAAELLAQLMYRNILGNPSYVKWCLTIVEVFLSCVSLLMGMFIPKERVRWRKNVYCISRGVYFIVTRSVFHVPRTCLLLMQLAFIALGTLLYNLGRERVFVLCSCCGCFGYHRTPWIVKPFCSNIYMLILLRCTVGVGLC